MEEMVKAVNVYEKDGVVVEETIEVPVDEFETLKEYMGAKDDNQEEYNPEVTGETEDLPDVEEGEVEPEDEPEYDEPEEVEELEEVVCVDTIEDDVPVVVEAILLDQEEEMFLESFLDYDIEDEDDDEEDID